MNHPGCLRTWLLPLHHTWPKQTPFGEMLCPFDDRRLGPPATKAGTSNLRLNLWKIGGCQISISPESQERHAKMVEIPI